MDNKHILIQHKFSKDGFPVHSLWRDNPANMGVNLSRYKGNSCVDNKHILN